MMYSEFLRIGGDKVKNISFTEYSEMVEPLYLYCDIEKHIFVERLVNHFEEGVLPILSEAMNHLSDISKADIAKGEEYIAEYLPAVALEARKLVYQMMRLPKTIQIRNFPLFIRVLSRAGIINYNIGTLEKEK